MTRCGRLAVHAAQQEEAKAIAVRSWCGESGASWVWVVHHDAVAANDGMLFAARPYAAHNVVNVKAGVQRDPLEPLRAEVVWVNLPIEIG